MTGIVLAADLTLPVEAVTQTFAVLAKRGVGKSTTARRMAEATGRSLTSSAFNPTLRDLVERDLVERDGAMYRAADVFFEGGR